MESVVPGEIVPRGNQIHGERAEAPLFLTDEVINRLNRKNSSKKRRRKITFDQLFGQ
jgi:hypothetical protein